MYDISHSYPLAFFESGVLCALASYIVHLVPVFQESTFSEESSQEKKTILENKYPRLCPQDLCHLCHLFYVTIVAGRNAPK